jgi:hypothetical protein
MNALLPVLICEPPAVASLTRSRICALLSQKNSAPFQSGVISDIGDVDAVRAAILLIVGDHGDVACEVRVLVLVIPFTVAHSHGQRSARVPARTRGPAAAATIVILHLLHGSHHIGMAIDENPERWRSAAGSRRHGRWRWAMNHLRFCLSLG